MVDSNNITTFMRWPGSKWRIADWIIAHFPDHGVYCEPFFGSGAVFFRKFPSGTETINDIDGDIVNLFRVIRDVADMLCKKVEMTPYSRDEYEASSADCDNAVERARRFLVWIWQGYGGKTYCNASWSHSWVNGVFRPKYWCEVSDKIMTVVSRLKIMITNSYHAGSFNLFKERTSNFITAFLRGETSCIPTGVTCFFSVRLKDYKKER